MRYKLLGLVAVLVYMSACSQSPEESIQSTGSQHQAEKQTENKNTASLATLKVYKSPTCGCCGIWVEHMQDHGFTTDVTDMDNLNAIKADIGVPNDAQSCHTGVSESGHFFEGHIPAKLVQRFLQAPPEGALGLAVPGMPMGSPGMEMGDSFSPYQVMQVNGDGTTVVYAEVSTKEDQY